MEQNSEDQLIDMNNSIQILSMEERLGYREMKLEAAARIDEIKYLHDPGMELFKLKKMPRNSNMELSYHYIKNVMLGTLPITGYTINEHSCNSLNNDNRRKKKVMERTQFGFRTGKRYIYVLCTMKMLSTKSEDE